MPESKQGQPSQATQQFIEIKSVKNGVLILKNGGLRQILMVSGMNFDLKSEEEQEAITFAYQNFLNSLNFSIEIFIHSRKLNINNYLNNLSKLEVQETNPLLRTQIAEYREFIRSFVAENAIMNKTFFIVVPFDPVVIPEAGKAITKGLFGMFSKGAPITANEEDDRQFNINVGQLSQRADQVVSGLNQIGLRAIPLNDSEVVELFYNLYNPESTEKKNLEVQKS